MRIGMWVCGLVLIASPAISQESLTDRPAIVVIGRGQAEQVPDTFRVSADIEGRGSTQVEALSSLAEAQQSVTEALEGAEGLDTTTVTSSNPNVTAQYDADCVSQRSGDRQNCPITGYMARMLIQLQGSPIARAGDVVSLASERGAVNARLDTAFLSSDRDLHLQARRAAFEDARAQAEALAEASGRRLGPILRIQDPAASGPPAPPPPPAPEIVATGSRVVRPSVPLVYAPPPVRVDSRLTVVFELQ